MGILNLPPETIAGDLRELGLTAEGFRTVVAQFSRDHAYSISRLRQTGLNAGDADEFVEQLFEGSSVNLELIVDERKRIDRPSRFTTTGEMVISSPRTARQKSLRPPAFNYLLAATRPSPIFLSLVAAFIFSGIALAIGPSADYFKPFIIVFIVSGWFVSLCLHEYGHAAAAYVGGDDSVKFMGYLTLNPLKYTSPLFTIIFPLVSLTLGRIPLPGGAVAIQTSRLRSREAELAVNVGGPFTNVIFVTLLAAPFAFHITTRYPQFDALWFGMAGLLTVEVFVLLLNLLPIPPLDGFHILSYWLSYETQNAANNLGWYPMIFLYAMLRTPNPLSNLLYSTVDGYLNYVNLDPAIGWWALSYLHF
jgi:Zn-dependent protease